MRLPEALRSLRYRDFRAIFGAQTISQIWGAGGLAALAVLVGARRPRVVGNQS